MNEHLEKFHESGMFDKGVDRYDRKFVSAQASGRMTAPEFSFMKDLTGDTISAFEEVITTNQPHRPMMDWQLDAQKIGAAPCVIFAYQVLFNMGKGSSNTTGEHKSRGGTSDKSSYTALASKIGVMCYDQIEDKPTDQLEFKRRALVLGSNLIETVCAMSDPAFVIIRSENAGGISNEATRVVLTDSALKHMDDIYDNQRISKPVFSPMLSEPKSILEGSYYDERVASKVRLVKTWNRDHKAVVRESAVLGARWVDAVNAIQSVPLKINTELVHIIRRAYEINHLSVTDKGEHVRKFRKIPPSSLPQGLSKKEGYQYKSLQATFLSDLTEARSMTNEERMFLPAFLDFRGRVYAIPSLNHQAADWMKSLWMFADGKPIETKEAGDWLKIHLANTGDFDKISKASFENRVKWVDDNHDRIMAFGADPFTDPEWFYGEDGKDGASEPFLFAAACIEYRKWQLQGSSYICHLPVAIDGSNSGLQHFSAMLRDDTTGKRVNLIPGEQPEDVYRDAAEILIEILKDDLKNADEATQKLATEWLDFGITRKTTKRSTMTICYGSRKGGVTKSNSTNKMELFGWAEQLMSDVISEKKHKFENPIKSAVYLANHLDTVLRQIAPKPMEVMDWLQHLAGIMAKENLPITWFTPLSFPVYNAYYKVKEARVNVTVKGRRLQNRFVYGYTDQLVASKQRTSMSPNFVHSCDATHLQMAALTAKESGIHQFLLIHDSFSCLPSDMEQFSAIVKDTFVELYENWDPLQDLHNRVLAALPENKRSKVLPPPQRGSLDLRNTSKSHYAFA
jgi:DNA-directed RNA polymerase